ncbi:MAG: amino acid ABC transporter substrate-binding protein, partial [candidate division NC10 bacterium]|nr:amino acid ABC transporter substrate-binding protein [candidate division NC10 bacterium]
MNRKRWFWPDGLYRREFLKASGAAGLTAFVSGYPVATFGQDKKPVKIGFSMSLTGQYAETGKYQNEGYELWKKHVNARGGLLGRPVELVFYDDKSDPATAAKLFEKLITDDKVDLIIGPYSSATTATAGQVARKYEMPMITAGASSEKIFQQGNKYVFMVYTPAGHYLDGAFDIAAKRGLKTVAIINENTLFPKSTADGGAEVATKTYKLQVVFREEHPKGATDVSGILTKIKALNPDVLVSGSYFPDAVLIVRQMKELDVNPKMYAATVGAALDEFGGSKGVGKDAEYVYGASQWEPNPKLPYPGIATFIADYKKEFGRDPDYHSSSGYAAGEVLEAGARKVGSLD